MQRPDWRSPCWASERRSSTRPTVWSHLLVAAAVLLGFAAPGLEADEPADGGGWRYSKTPPETGVESAKPAAEPSGSSVPVELQPAPEGPAPRPTDSAADQGSPETPGGESAGSERVEELLLSVMLNGRETGYTVLVIRDASGRVLLAPADLDMLGLRVPDSDPLVHDGTNYHAVEAMAGVTADIDLRTVVLSLNAPASAMQGQRLSARDDGYHPPDDPAAGIFLNHDVLAEVDDSGENASGFLELGAFGGMGSLNSTQVFRDLGGDAEIVRLETTWRKDFPASMQSLRLGDAVGVPGSWGRPVRFGGIQWGTNFATRPDFITFPLPSLEGETALPSTVDVYINNARRFSREIPAGPFAINDVPALTGSGDIELVVRDILGRERTIVQPYYASSRLLRDGLHEYSYEIGSERELFGQESADYGRIFGTATHRLGLTDYVTGELRAEFVEGDQQSAGLAVSALWPATGVWSLAVAGSRQGAETGELLSAGFERQGRRFSVGGQVEYTDEAFTQVGLPPGTSAPGRTTRLFASSRFARRGSVAVSYVDRFSREEDDVQFAQGTLSWGLGRLGSLRLSALYPLEGDDDVTIALGYSRSLGGRRSLHGQATTGGGQTIGEMRLQRNAPPGPGSGYALTAAAGDRERLNGRYIHNTTHGAYTVEAESADGQEALRAGMTGSVAWLGGRPMLARDLGDAFAVVEVPGQAGIDVYRSNQIVSRTNSQGRAIVHGLLPYDRNSIRIDATQLPLDVQPGETEWRIVPYHRSGVRVRAEAERSKGAVFRVVGDNGEPLPAGAMLSREDAAETFPVGYDGFSYVTGLGTETRLRAQWNGRTCAFDLSYPDTDEPLPDLGEIVCRQEDVR